MLRKLLIILLSFKKKLVFTFQPAHCIVSHLSINHIIQVKLHICLFSMQTRNVIRRDGHHFTDCTDTHGVILLSRMKQAWSSIILGVLIA